MTNIDECVLTFSAFDIDTKHDVGYVCLLEQPEKGDLITHPVTGKDCEVTFVDGDEISITSRVSPRYMLKGFVRYEKPIIIAYNAPILELKSYFEEYQKNSFRLFDYLEIQKLDGTVIFTCERTASWPVLFPQPR